jgi:hypothetical protein
MQPPMPLQAELTSVVPVQPVPQPGCCPLGYTHVPLLSQSVAPQGLPTPLHELAQQCVPTPMGPQIPLWHCELIAHGAPGPPDVVPEEPVVEATEVEEVGVTHEPP